MLASTVRPPTAMPTPVLDRCSRAYGDVFTMRLPFGMNLVHIARLELVKAVFGGDSDVLRAGEANATILSPLKSGSGSVRCRSCARTGRSTGRCRRGADRPSTLAAA